MSPEAFSVRTDAFNGPLELLLYLIDKHEVDILDIPVALIAEQYIEHIKAIEGADMETLSAFLLMAATLLYIKARMLLPEAAGQPEAAAEDGADPREELVLRLLRYKRFKELSGELGEREKEGLQAFYKGWDETVPASPETGGDNSLDGVVGIDRLRDIFMELLLRKDRRVDKVRSGFSGVSRERFTVTDCMRRITAVLRRGKAVGFLTLFDRTASMDEKITTFLALLELIKQNRVKVTQAGPFDEIICSLR